MLQDSHVAEQRQFYDAHKDKCSDFWEWNDLPLDNQQQVYMLVLKERFDSTEMKKWEIDWFEGFKSYLEKHYTICPICGIYSLGEMCGGKKKVLPYAILTTPWSIDMPNIFM